MTQYDIKIRTLALTNLEAACERVSGVCHCFKVVKVSRSRVHVQYSNPDEYGNDHPVVGIYPCIPGFERDTPLVVLALLRVVGGGDDAAELFYALENCPTLYWDVSKGEWRSHLDIRRSGDEVHGSVTCGCTVCDVSAWVCKHCCGEWSDGNPVEFREDANRQGLYCKDCWEEPRYLPTKKGA